MLPGAQDEDARNDVPGEHGRVVYRVRGFYAMTQLECSDVLVLSESMRTSSTAGSSTGTGEEMVKNASMADELSW